jgi:hypothetical protein
VDLEPGLRQPAGIAQRVRDLELVPDVPEKLADRVPCLEVDQREARHDVAPADHEDTQVHEVEQEWQARRERRDQDDRGDGQDLQAADHAARP